MGRIFRSYGIASEIEIRKWRGRFENSLDHHKLVTLYLSSHACYCFWEQWLDFVML